MSEDVQGSADLEELWGAGTPDGFRRLWAPHRMAYIAGESGTGQVEGGGCPLCRIPTLDDSEGLVLHRGVRVYAVLNLHPYNPGHLMVVPYRHVAGLDELDLEESAELVAVTQQAVRALRAVAAPHGFNVGINLGHVAGGSLADHLHQHVVPRWGGDANFITVIGQTKVIPQLLAETRARLAEAWPVPGDGAQRSSTRVEGDAAQRSLTRVEGDAAQRSSTRVEGDAAQRSSTRVEGDAAQRSSTRVEGDGAQRSSARVEGDAAQRSSTGVEGAGSP